MRSTWLQKQQEKENHLINDQNIGRFILLFDKQLKKRQKHLQCLKNLYEHLEGYLSNVPSCALNDDTFRIIDHTLKKFDKSIAVNTDMLRNSTLKLADSLKLAHETMEQYFQSIKKSLDRRVTSNGHGHGYGNEYPMSAIKFENSCKLETLIAKCEVSIKVLLSDTGFVTKMPFVSGYLQLPNTEKNPFLLNEESLQQLYPRFKQTEIMKCASFDLKYIIAKREVAKKFQIDTKMIKTLLHAHRWITHAQESMQVSRFNKYQKLRDCPCSILITSVKNDEIK